MSAPSVIRRSIVSRLVQAIGSVCQYTVRAAGRAREPGIRRLVGLAVLGAASLLSACGTLPHPVPRPVSLAIALPHDGELPRIARASTPPDGLSGFRLLPLGRFALDTRLQLARRAQHSLDLQYYVIEDDSSGRILLRHLRNAALRGVRVRLLVDDLFTTSISQTLRALAAYPNVEVRLFNPFCCARGSMFGRFAGSLFDLYRLNHRMHNKLFIADGVMAVVGGRNIGDEYFMRGGIQNFVDLDALVMGSVVGELAATFDRYWNSEVVYPVQAIVGAAADAKELRASFDDLTPGDDVPPDLPAVDVLGYGPVSEELDSGRVGMVWGPARVIADPPDKRDSPSAEHASAASVTHDVRMQIWRAQHELVLTSPYLIPGRMGMEAFQDLAARQVKMTVITNSLAATDEPLVHAGYARYREPLLRAGVDLYELSPERTRRNRRLGLFGASSGRLHAKTAIVDHKTVFIGSMNLDPRSETQNTEMGIFVDSAELALELHRILRITKLQSSYRLRLAPTGSGVQWLALDDEAEVVLNTEPESSLWMRWYNLLVAPLVPEQLL